MLKTVIDLKDLSVEIKSVLEKDIKVKKLILFGSRATGNAREDSDIDIAVISDDLAAISVMERIELFARVPVLVDSRIELKGYTFKEYLSPEPASLLEVIKSTGKELI
jgi:predicted nucleotidyltransferase